MSASRCPLGGAAGASALSYIIPIARDDRNDRGVGVGTLGHRHLRLHNVYLWNCPALAVGRPQDLTHEFSGRSDAIGEKVQRESGWARSPALGVQQLLC